MKIREVIKLIEEDGVGIPMYRYLVIIEEINGAYSAYSPDLPGCVATGNSHEDVEKNMQEAIALQIHGLVEDQEPVPAPRSIAEYVSVPVE
jgi:predicted RNase H-like HicB family nuclease